MSHRNLSSAQFVPPTYGSQPIPEGMVRFNHYTNEDAVEGIAKDGILRSKSEEKFAHHGTESPQVFATTGAPRESLLHERPVVEGYAHPDELDIGWNWSPEQLEEHRSVITFHGDVPPEHIIAIHQPWHHKARYMEGAPDVLERVVRGEHDDLMDDPDYGPAIRYIKRKHGVPPR